MVNAEPVNKGDGFPGPDDDHLSYKVVLFPVYANLALYTPIDSLLAVINVGAAAMTPPATTKVSAVPPADAEWSCTTR